MSKTGSKTITFFVALTVWMLLCWEISIASILTGVIVAFLISAVCGHLFLNYPHKWAQPKRYLYFLLYVVIFLRECVKANMNVAARIVKPTMPINPGIVKVKTRLRSETALTFLANSITLTPGTLTVDIEGDKGILYIHWIDVKDKELTEATNHIVKKFEDIIEKVFE